MNRIFFMLKSFPVKFFLIAALSAFVFAFILLFSLREYRTTGTMVVVSRSAVNANTTAETLAYLVEQGTFVDRLLAEHASIFENDATMSSTEREAGWRGVMTANVPSETGIVTLSVIAGTSQQSSTLLRASVETLYGFSSDLYGSETRIVPIGNTTLSQAVRHPIILSFESIALGVILAILLTSRAAASLRMVVRSLIARRFHSRVADSEQASVSGEYFPAKKTADTLRPIGSFESVRSAPPSRQDENISTESERVASDVSKKEMITEAAQRKPLTVRQSAARQEATASASPLPVEKIAPSPASASLSVPSQSVGIDSSRQSVESTKTNFEDMAIVKAIETKRREVVNQSSMPGVLPSIPASEFTWEKYLFSEEGSARETQETEGASSTSQAVSSKETEVAPSEKESETSETVEEVLPEKREPTPEELKARLNKLLRGEL